MLLSALEQFVAEQMMHLPRMAAQPELNMHNGFKRLQAKIKVNGTSKSIIHALAYCVNGVLFVLDAFRNGSHEGYVNIKGCNKAISSTKTLLFVAFPCSVFAHFAKLLCIILGCARFILIAAACCDFVVIIPRNGIVSEENILIHTMYMNQPATLSASLVKSLIKCDGDVNSKDICTTIYLMKRIQQNNKFSVCTKALLSCDVCCRNQSQLNIRA